MTTVVIMRAAVVVEILLLAFYWFFFFKNHVSAATAVKILRKSWGRVWARLPKYISIPYLILIPIGLFLLVAFFFVESETYSGSVGATILVLLPLIVYILLAPLKGRVDGLLLRRRLRRLKGLPMPSEFDAVFRSIPMLIWYAGFGLFFLVLGFRGAEIGEVKAPVFFAAAIFGFYWLVVVILMPDFKVTTGTLLVRRKRWEIFPYYGRFSIDDFQFLIDGSDIKVRQNGKDVESVRVDKMSDKGLTQVYALTRSRT